MALFKLLDVREGDAAPSKELSARRGDGTTVAATSPLTMTVICPGSRRRRSSIAMIPASTTDF